MVSVVCGDLFLPGIVLVWCRKSMHFFGEGFIVGVSFIDWSRKSGHFSSEGFILGVSIMLYGCYYAFIFHLHCDSV